MNRRNAIVVPLLALTLLVVPAAFAGKGGVRPISWYPSIRRLTRRTRAQAVAVTHREGLVPDFAAHSIVFA